MEKIKLVAEKREGVGKKFARKLRREGYLPGILYSKDINIPIKVLKKDFLKVLGGVDNPETAIFDIEYKDNGGSTPYQAILKDMQIDPITDDIIHVDFYRIKMDEEVVITVPVYLKGEAIGVKKGGILEHFIHELEVKCLPANIPEKIEIDVSPLDINDAIHVEDIKIDGVEILDDPETVIVLVGSAEEETAEEGGEEEAETSQEGE